MRKSGFYWIIPNDTLVWEIAIFNEFIKGGIWFRYGSSEYCTDSFLAEINEKQLLPPKKKKTCSG